MLKFPTKNPYPRKNFIDIGVPICDHFPILRGSSSVGLERQPVTLEVAGSSPVYPAILFFDLHFLCLIFD